MELKYSSIKIATTLNESDTPKLRGYFGNRFIDNDIFHNHGEKLIYRYPIIQYKIINKNPYIIGLNDGAMQILQILNEKEIIIENKKIPINFTEVKYITEKFGISNENIYEFITPWAALNQENERKFKICPEKDKKKFLENILIGNIMSMSKDMKYQVPEKIECELNDVKIKNISIKNVPMLGFIANFKINFELPNYIGLGRSVSRGFGTIRKINRKF